MNTKGLDELSPRIQRFRMRRMRYSYKLIYTAGKNLTTGDCTAGKNLTTAVQIKGDLHGG